MSLEAGLIGFAGLASLAAAMNRRRFGSALPAALTPPMARILGWGLLSASAVMACLGLGAALGVVAWIGQVSVAGVLLILLMSWRPTAVPGAAVAALACAPLALVLSA